MQITVGDFISQYSILKNIALETIIALEKIHDV